MQTNRKTARFFSGPLMKQNIKSNAVLTVVICLVFCMMTTVITFAMSIMGGSDTTAETKDAQADFYAHLFAIASYNQISGSSLSADDFMKEEDKTTYDTVFAMMNQKSE